MRVSVEIDENTLQEVMTLTGESNKGPALTKAVVEYVRRQKAREFGRMIREGAFDYPRYTVEEEKALNPIPPLSEG